MIWSFYTIGCAQIKLVLMFLKQKLLCLGTQRKKLIMIWNAFVSAKKTKYLVAHIETNLEDTIEWSS